jgi:hypothetical protein
MALLVPFRRHKTSGVFPTTHAVHTANATSFTP